MIWSYKNRSFRRLFNSYQRVKMPPPSELARQTVWIDANTLRDSQPVYANKTQLQALHASRVIPNATCPKSPRGEATCKIIDRHPKDDLYSIAEVIYDQTTRLARWKDGKRGLVHIQEVNCDASVCDTLEAHHGRVPHASFRQLLGAYRHSGSMFLIWEPVEISVEQIRVAKCTIQANEIIAIVKPVSDVYHSGYRVISHDGRCSKESNILRKSTAKS